jgi:hypothetical protein
MQERMKLEFLVSKVPIFNKVVILCRALLHAPKQHH